MSSIAGCGLPTIVALCYAIVAYVSGLLLIASAGIWFFAGVLLLAHGMVIAAFLFHECAHESLFASRPQQGVDRHRVLGSFLSWLTGASYSSFDAIKDKHLRHHFDRADIVAVDYRHLLRASAWLRSVVEAGQWLCLPAVEWLMHLLVLTRPFGRGDRAGQQRIIVMGLLRAAFFSFLVWQLNWLIVPGYLLAYCLLLTVMGFMDTFQHQYLLLEGLDKPRRESPTRDRSRFGTDYFSRVYEESHTFSNLISRRWPLLNLLVLNFCYHNAHHRQPMAPWHRLPALHQSCYPASGTAPVISLRRQLKDYFRYRVARVMAEPNDQEVVLTSASSDQSGQGNIGAAGVSFLTPL